MSDFFNNFFSYYKSRIESPLFFSFILSWLAWNSDFLWKIAFIAPSQKYLAVSNHLFSWEESFGYPLITAVTYIVIAPLLNSAVLWLKYYATMKLDEQVAVLKNQHDQLLEFRDYRDAAKKLQSENSDLKNQVSELASYKSKTTFELEQLKRSAVIDQNYTNHTQESYIAAKSILGRIRNGSLTLKAVTQGDEYSFANVKLFNEQKNAYQEQSFYLFQLYELVDVSMTDVRQALAVVRVGSSIKLPKHGGGIYHYEVVDLMSWQ